MRVQELFTEFKKIKRRPNTDVVNTAPFCEIFPYNRGKCPKNWESFNSCHPVSGWNFRFSKILMAESFWKVIFEVLWLHFGQNQIFWLARFLFFWWRHNHVFVIFVIFGIFDPFKKAQKWKLDQFLKYTPRNNPYDVR